MVTSLKSQLSALAANKLIEKMKKEKKRRDWPNNLKNKGEREHNMKARVRMKNPFL